MSFAYSEVPVGAVNGVNLVFTLANAPNPGLSLRLFAGGVRLTQGTDYLLVGNQITFLNPPGGPGAPNTGTVLLADYEFLTTAPAPSGAGTFPEYTGADLLTQLIDRLGGYGNALNADVMFDTLNEGKDAVWTILKTLNENFFQRSSQSTDPTKVNYFGSFNTTSREYQLPGDFRAMRFIECVTPGFSAVRFKKKLMTDDDWKEARFAANDPQNSTLGTGQYDFWYDIIESDAGGFELIFAQFFPVNLQATLFYIRGIPDFEAGDVINQILRPYSRKIVTYAVEKCMKIVQDEVMSEEWRNAWEKDVISIAIGAGPVNMADAKFVDDFEA